MSSAWRSQEIGKRTLRLLCGLVYIALAAVSAPFSGAAEGSRLSERYPVSADDGSVVFRSEPSYAAVLDGWREAGWEEAPEDAAAVAEGRAFTAFGDAAPQTDVIEGRECVLHTAETAWLEWTVNVPSDGLYILQIDYYAQDGSGLPIQRSVSVDGGVPFEEAGNLVLPRQFADTGRPRVNQLGDEVRPLQDERRSWLSRDVSDASGLYTLPLLWKLEAGERTLRLQYIDQPVAIGGVAFHGVRATPTYAEKRAEYATEGYTAARAAVEFEAEDIDRVAYRTGSAFSVYNDSDPLTTPSGVEYIRMNAMGGYAWREGAQEIAYRIEVPETGLYKLAVRVQQIWGNGLSSCRQILIDGQVPFREMEAYAFSYKRDWRVEALCDGEGAPYEFYLTKGTHTLTFVNKLDPQVTQAVQTMMDCSEDLSALLRKITLITSASPDLNYDYELDKAIPDLPAILESIEARLGRAGGRIMESASKRPSAVNNLEMTCRQLREMRQRPRSIPGRLEDLTASLTGIGDWITELKSTPLGMDSLGLYPPSQKLPSGTSGFFQKLGATVRNFIASFSKDYNAVGGFGSDGEIHTTLDVWISRGKEWGAILQELADSDFTPSRGVGVRLNILPSGTLSSAVNPLMLSINSGEVPDVVLSLTNNYPVEYAIRGVVADLSAMPGYEETVAQFDPKIMTPLRYRGGVYALPETTNFRVVFYRKDIFSELKIGVPDTWDEIFAKLLPVLYQNGMQMYVPSAYDLFLYQKGGRFYTDDGLKSALDTPEAVAAFEQMISLYLDMGIPITANFFNRFRSGEMPIGIDSYTMYVSLLTAAPELAGKWGIAALPGTEIDGQVNRSTALLTGEADIIMQDAAHPQEAWQFLQWWTGKETQTAFGAQVEGRIGTYARWNTANLEAFASLPWNREDLAVIREQWTWSEDPPTVLGGYYTARHITNALNRCLYSGQSPRDSLEEAVEQIDKELTRKQQLYGIFTENGGK